MDFGSLNKFDKKLLEKYSYPVPRYTSYPTVPVWSRDFGNSNYKNALNEFVRGKNKLLDLYIHIPFCQKRCHFCGCASRVENDSSVHSDYLDAICKEAKTVTKILDSKNTLSRLHLGGGTPLNLNLENLKKLFGIIESNFGFTDDAELSVETNPTVTDFDKIELLLEFGFNRISFGIQDFDKRVQTIIGREQSYKHIQKLLDKVRKGGFTGVNFDMVYGLPGQTETTWEKTIKTTIDLNPDRIAVFGYAHVPWMRPHQKKLEEYDLPTTPQRFKMSRIAHHLLTNAGYHRIGMDHYARSSDELVKAFNNRRLSRNFQGYTTIKAGDSIGLGMTSIGEIGGSYAQNTVSLKEYLKRTASSGFAVSKGFKCSKDDLLRKYVIREIMCNLRVIFKDVKTRFNIDCASHFAKELLILEDHVADGIVKMKKEKLEVTFSGRDFVRNIAAVFDNYFNDSKAKGAAGRFSKGI